MMTLDPTRTIAPALPLPLPSALSGAALSGPALIHELCTCLHARETYLRLWQRVRHHAPALLTHVRGVVLDGCTQAELADRIGGGADLATVAKIEGGFEMMGQDLAVRLARMLSREGVIVGVERLSPGRKG